MELCTQPLPRSLQVLLPPVATPHPELPAGEVVEDVLAEERRVEAAAGAGGPDAAELCEDVVAGRLVDEHVGGGAHGQEQGHVHHLLQPRLTVRRLVVLITFDIARTQLLILK